MEFAIRGDDWLNADVQSIYNEQLDHLARAQVKLAHLHLCRHVARAPTWQMNIRIDLQNEHHMQASWEFHSKRTTFRPA
jgi:hypothetical protein